jgi:hypothetical protein
VSSRLLLGGKRDRVGHPSAAPGAVSWDRTARFIRAHEGQASAEVGDSLPVARLVRSELTNTKLAGSRVGRQSRMSRDTRVGPLPFNPARLLSLSLGLARS